MLLHRVSPSAILLPSPIADGMQAMPGTGASQLFLASSHGMVFARLHDARHTFATLMPELGVSPKTVRTMLGHSSVAITLDVYSHVSLELKKKAASRLNAALTRENWVVVGLLGQRGQDGSFCNA
jgi:hypothetical protein